MRPLLYLRSQGFIAALVMSRTPIKPHKSDDQVGVGM